MGRKSKISAILGKEVNFVDFTDFLDSLQTGTIVSHMHSNSIPLLHEIEEKGKAEWEGNELSKERLLERLADETGHITEFSLLKTPYGPETVLKFSSGNGFTVSLKNEIQHAQIYQYLLDL